MEDKRYFLEIAYRGTNYHGWQIQANAHTVQEAVNLALSVVLRKPITTMGSGRTDTGVHARQQFLHFDVHGELENKDFLKRLNAVLPKDIAALDLREVRPDAHARFDAEWRRYEYRIYFGKNPFEEGLVWQYFTTLNIDQMKTAAELLLSHRDFECFSKVKTEVNHFECEIKSVYWEQKGQHLIFHITANRFLRGMVRAIVGTLVEVGKEKLSVNGFNEVMASKNRNRAGSSVPACGLYLCQISYPKGVFI